MIASGEKVLADMAGMDQRAFIAITHVFDATVRNLELIGEALPHVPDEVSLGFVRICLATRNARARTGS